MFNINEVFQDFVMVQEQRVRSRGQIRTQFVLRVLIGLSGPTWSGCVELNKGGVLKQSEGGKALGRVTKRRWE